MNILVIGGSNSKNSINRKLASHAASLFKSTSTHLVDISSLDLALYSVDKEVETGIPEIILDFAKKIDNTDLIVLSLAENNGSYNAGFKNLIDWTSRIKNRKTFGEKPMLLMATSPGGRGGATVLEAAKNYFPYMGAVVKATFSLPNFHKNFDDKEGITNPELQQQLVTIIEGL
jgi:NAD(P)H-dependent FMN reductase